MFNEPVKEFFYSSYKIDAQFSDGGKIIDGIDGGQVIGFVISVAEGVPWIVTNRHVVDRDYNQISSGYKDFKLSKFLITGRKSDDSQYTFELEITDSCFLP